MDNYSHLFFGNTLKKLENWTTEFQPRNVVTPWDTGTKLSSDASRRSFCCWAALRNSMRSAAETRTTTRRAKHQVIFREFFCFILQRFQLWFDEKIGNFIRPIKIVKIQRVCIVLLVNNFDLTRKIRFWRQVIVNFSLDINFDLTGKFNSQVNFVKLKWLWFGVKK